MGLDDLLLSRAQFAFTIAFHILFPTLTIGLSLFLVALEGMWLATGREVWFRLYRFWVKVFALAFGVGVVTGIVLSYEVGTNWSRFALVTGNVLGPLMSYEVLTAFFLEAGFLGIMLFGWRRVSPGMHFLATLLVAMGTVLSAFWILSANSWMQTPAGHAMGADGRFVVADWWAAVFNPSFPYRFAHMVTASFLTTAFVVAGVSAWYRLRGRHDAVARHGLALALLAAAVAAPTQVVLGDLHGLNTLEHQPVKVAAMEALWETRRGAPFVVFALPDQEAARNRAELAIPRAGSLILTHDWNGEVRGLESVPPADRPPVAVVFIAFRIMLGIGFLFVAVAAIGLYLRWTGHLFDRPWFLRLCVAVSPLGFVAMLAGWVVTEVGRQPWTVTGLLRTADSVSPAVAGSVAASLALFVAVYAVIGLAFLAYLFRVIRDGPDVTEEPPDFQSKARTIVETPR